MIIDGIEITGVEDHAEATAYVQRGRKLYGRSLKSVEVRLDENYAEISYHTAPLYFDRIRRITGYLVGTVDRWNNAKRAEEHDRVKHSIE